MADETKVYCYDKPADNSALWAAVMGNKSESPAELAALMNNNNWSNNPFVYLLFLLMFRNGGFGFGEGANVNADLNRISNTLADNHNSDLIIDAVKGNQNALTTLSATLNCDFNTLQTACCGIKSAIESVAGQVGYSSERVINAVNMGDASVVSKLQECCCQNKELVQRMGYENQLANERQTGLVMGRIDQLSNGVQQGFASVGYDSQRQTCDIINAGNANTQRVIDTLNNHWQSELQLKYQDAKAELSQQSQTNALTVQLNAIAAAIAKIPTT